MVVVENMNRSVTEKGIKYNYFYRMTKCKISQSHDNDTMIVQCYGIEVERQDIIDKSIKFIERDSIKVISPDRHKVHNLLKLLYDNIVSPIHMVDIIGSCADEYASDFDYCEREIATV